MRLELPIIIALAGALAASPLSAQGHGRDSVPAAQKPPAGMCRIWVDGVPAGQQPAPTDCPTAIRNRPANGRVIFGDDEPTKKLPMLPSFTGGTERRTPQVEPTKPEPKERPRRPSKPDGD